MYVALFDKKMAGRKASFDQLGPCTARMRVQGHAAFRKSRGGSIHTMHGRKRGWGGWPSYINVQSIHDIGDNNVRTGRGRFLGQFDKVCSAWGNAKTDGFVVYFASRTLWKTRIVCALQGNTSNVTYRNVKCMNVQITSNCVKAPSGALPSS